MNNYLHSAISKIYGEDDDFILIGLTDRTGSGCSTVAKILSQPIDKLNYSLFAGNNPTSNQQRKEKIIHEFVQRNWQPFVTIQVRTILTLMLAQCNNDDVISFIKSVSKEIESVKIDQIIDILENIKNDFTALADNENEKTNFYGAKLPAHSHKIREALSEGNFVKLYQTIGLNVRNSGSPIGSEITEGKFFTLAEKINEVVKEIRGERKGKEKTLIVIDAIRNPFEAIYFQDRYSSFYLMAVSCEDEQRKRRLRKTGFTDTQIAAIDEQEYSNLDISEEAAYVWQDIQACLQRADLYINNPDSRNIVSDFKDLTNQVLTFVSLMKHPGLITPTPIERCMQIAYTAKLNSGCISRQVGALITDKNFSVQAVGWNDAPHGQVPCNLRNRFDLELGNDQEAYSEFEKTDKDFLIKFKARTIKYIPIRDSGRNVSYCFKSEHNKNTGKENQVHTRSLHAEENAFLQISKYGGRGIEGGKLFTTASPCELCAKKAYQLGIMDIYYIDPYPGIAMKHILMGGVKDPKLTLFSGAIGRAFHRLYTPIVAYKDELNTLAEKIKN